MIVDHISNIKLYCGLNPFLVRGLDFLAQSDLHSLAPGKYEIDGSDVYAIISEYETKPEHEGKWEAHRNYNDIQFIVSGEERMGYAPVQTQKIKEAYNDEKDIMFLEGTGDFVTVKSGTFVVFTPFDSHKPCIMTDKPTKVKKIVIKACYDEYI